MCNHVHGRIKVPYSLSKSVGVKKASFMNITPTLFDKLYGNFIGFSILKNATSITCMLLEIQLDTIRDTILLFVDFRRAIYSGAIGRYSYL